MGEDETEGRSGEAEREKRGAFNRLRDRIMWNSAFFVFPSGKSAYPVLGVRVGSSFVRRRPKLNRLLEVGLSRQQAEYRCAVGSQDKASSS